MKKLIFILILSSTYLAIYAQAKDKAEADQLIYEELTSNYETENWHPKLIILGNRLEETAEKGIFIVKGDSFQIKSLRSDFYVWKKDGAWVTLHDARYPLETMVNLLLNRNENNRHKLNIRHHKYGGEAPMIAIPMQNFHDLLARNMQLYCSVTYIDKDEIRAILVLHQERMDFIHMLELKIPTELLFDETSTLVGDLYTNIPQNNVNSIFRERGKKEK